MSAGKETNELEHMDWSQMLYPLLLVGTWLLASVLASVGWSRRAMYLYCAVAGVGLVPMVLKAGRALRHGMLDINVLMVPHTYIL